MTLASPRPVSLNHLASRRLVAPSVLSADFTRLGETMQLLENAGIEVVHLDVMDGRFVPNMTFGPPVVRSIRAATRLILDVHLMIEEPERWVGAYLDAGADMVSVHVEAARHLNRAVAAIRDAGRLAGVAVNPATPLALLEEVLPEVDFVLLMSVNPGFGGQTFIPGVLGKIRRLKALLAAAGLAAAIEVDGGVGLANAQALVESGASVLVVGSAIFNSPDPKETIARLHQIVLT